VDEGFFAEAQVAAAGQIRRDGGGSALFDWALRPPA
jgi:hypothetical protein